LRGGCSYVAGEQKKWMWSGMMTYRPTFQR
jgi:hypothetical protein